jgi:hypothetical protein
LAGLLGAFFARMLFGWRRLGFILLAKHDASERERTADPNGDKGFHGSVFVGFCL